MNYKQIVATLLLISAIGTYGMNGHGRGRGKSNPPRMLAASPAPPAPPPSEDDLVPDYPVDPHTACVRAAGKLRTTRDIPQEIVDEALRNWAATEHGKYERLMRRLTPGQTPAEPPAENKRKIEADISRAISTLLLRQLEQTRGGPAHDTHAVNLASLGATGGLEQRVDPQELCVAFARDRRATKDHSPSLVREALAHMRETQPGRHDKLMRRMTTTRPNRSGLAVAGGESEEIKKAEAAIARALTTLLQTKLNTSEQNRQLLDEQVSGLTGQLGTMTSQLLRDGTIKKGAIISLAIALLIAGTNIATMVMEKTSSPA